ncbi:MAG: sarcosine oxidase subunit alpha family protein, partial [Caulobacterales bacterium]
MTAQPLRLAAGGGAIDRTRTLRFTFDGETYEGHAGDTLASALLANDVKLIGRSFKYHRPRGLLTAGSEEPNGLVTLGEGEQSEPNVRATTAMLSEGLKAFSQNNWPSLKWDLLSVNSAFAPFLAAGFYYKTFMWPSAFWEKVYEPIIRRSAGLGALSGEADPSFYDRNHAFCDVLVIGAGPAGISAALIAARAGLRVILADEHRWFGGRLLSETHLINGAPANDWVHASVKELCKLPNVTFLRRTVVFGLYDGGNFGALQTLADVDPGGGKPKQCYWKIVARRSILATGALERPMVFGGNDLPGVMLASAAQTYAHRFGVAPGKRVAVYASSDSGHAMAGELEMAGVNVVAVVDPREAIAKCRTKAPKFLKSQIANAHGGQNVRSIDIVDYSGARSRIEVDALLMAGGWTPNIGLASHLGDRPKWSDPERRFLFQSLPEGMRIAGAAAGRYTLAQTLSDGGAMGAETVRALGLTPPPIPTMDSSTETSGFEPAWRTIGAKKKAFVDFQNDVTAADIALAAQEGYSSIEHLKRYTTLGMATDQGKFSNLNGAALLADASGKSLSDLGVVIARPPHQPVAIGAFAGMHRGEHFRPARHTPSHAFAEGLGAVFVDAGAWRRAQYYPRDGEADWLQTATREVNTVRSAVGVCDVSTLGKIDVQGADAAEFLDRIYCNTISTLKPGKARYGLMLREDALVLDDGTVARFADDRFFVTTTTVNAGRVMQHLEYCRQVLWPNLDVQLSSVTEQWAQFAIAGPQSRALAARILPDIDLSNGAFPYMAAAETAWRGAPARIYRLSFSGELAFEIGVPSVYGDAFMRALISAGQDLGVAPYGTEAMAIMRIEKGHAAGGELNGQVTAGDLGL